MPTPRRRVTVAPQQPVQSSVRTPDRRLIASQRRLTQQQSGALSDVDEFARRMVVEADNLAINSFKNEIDREQIDIENEALQTKGKNSFQSTENATKRFSDFMDKLEGEAVGPVQKAQLRRMRQTAESQIRRTTESHTLKEIEKVKDQEFTASLTNITESSLMHWNDAERLTENNAEFLSLTEAEANRQGFDDEARETFTMQRMSTYHKAIFDKMITNKQSELARDYVDFYGKDLKQISTSTMDEMDKVLNESDNRRKSQESSDEIISKFETWPERFEAARKIDDPEIRDKTVARLGNRRDLDKSLEAERKSDLYLDGVNALEQNIGENPAEVIPESTWMQYTITQREALKRYARNLNPQTARIQNWEKFRQFWQLPAEDLVKMTSEEVQVKWASHFDKSHYTQAMQHWAKVKEQAKEGVEITIFRNPEEVMVDTLIRAGYVDRANISKHATADAKLVERFSRRFRTRFREKEESLGKKITDERDVQVIVNQVLAEEASIDEGIFFDDVEKRRIIDIPAGQEFPGAIRDFSSEEGKISRAEFNEIMGIINSHPRTKTLKKSDKEELARRIGFADQIGDQQLVDDLLSGRVK